MTTPVLKTEKDCTGCLACVAVCPQKAILLRDVGFHAYIPYIDAQKCVACGKCERVCRYELPPRETLPKAFAAVHTDRELLEKSASGGVFSAAAKWILSRGGAVIGAALYSDGETLCVKHECIEDLRDLPGLLGSKYVQSDCREAYEKAKAALKAGKPVLFGGTSCQVKALYAYLSGTDTKNLYTVDLICHGVPSPAFFNEYIRHLETKYRGKIGNVSFRTKKDGRIRYEITAVLKKSDGTEKTVTVPLRNSSYYRMFMGAESYREACYSCPYASADKPADITAGDYFEIRADYPELLSGKEALRTDLGVSSVIVHSEKGCLLLSEIKDMLQCAEVDLKKVVRAHAQLQRPSAYRDRPRLFEIYKKKGFAGLERFYRKKNLFDWKENLSIIVGRNNIQRIKSIAKRVLHR